MQGQGTGLNLGGLGTGGLKLGQTGGLQLGSGGSQPSTGLQLGQQATSTGGGLGGGLTLGGGVGVQLGQPSGQGGGLGQLTGGVKLNLPAPSAGTAGGGLKLGQTSAGGLQLGQSTQSGLQLGQPGALGGGLKLGGMGGPKLPSYSSATQPTQTTAGGLQVGGLGKPGGGLQLGAQTIQSGGVQLGGLGAQTSQASGLQLGGLTTKPGLQLAGGQTTKPGGPQLLASSGALPLSGLSASQAKPGSLGTPNVGGLKVSSGVGLKTTTAGGLPGYVTMATTTTGAPPPTKKYTYKELEGLVNKWTLELQAQEKLFLQQAAQVNKWDRVLAENGDKIVELNTEVDRVKSEQQRVDSELEMIQTQQNELEVLLTQLEQQVSHTPTHGGLHADMQRTRTFQMAEGIDSQLKHMSNDLKMIIEQMNESNTTTDEENPFTQIVRILNAHTDSLGWIDHEAAMLRKKVDDVAKVTESHRREQQLSFANLAFSHQ